MKLDNRQYYWLPLSRIVEPYTSEICFLFYLHFARKLTLQLLQFSAVLCIISVSVMPEIIQGYQILVGKNVKDLRMLEPILAPNSPEKSVCTWTIDRTLIGVTIITIELWDLPPIFLTSFHSWSLLGVTVEYWEYGLNAKCIYLLPLFLFNADLNFELVPEENVTPEMDNNSRRMISGYKRWKISK